MDAETPLEGHRETPRVLPLAQSNSQTNLERNQGSRETREEIIRKQETERRQETARAELALFAEERTKIYQEMHLSEREQSVAETLLLNTASGQDGESLYAQRLQPEHQERICSAVDRVDREILRRNQWPLRRLEDADVSRFARWEFIVHPLYSMMYLPDDLGGQWNPDTWERLPSEQRTIQPFVLSHLRQSAGAALAALQASPNTVPEGYLHLMEAIQEWRAMRTAPAAGTLRIFVMPRRALLSLTQREAMDSLLRAVGGVDNAVVTESLEARTGTLRPQVLNTLRRQVSPQTEINLQGGYLDGCLDACLESLYSNLRRRDLRYSVSFDPSTSHPSSFSNVQNARNRPRIRLPHAQDAATMRFEDIADWVESNEEFNRFYHDLYLPQYRERVNKSLRDLRIIRDIPDTESPPSVSVSMSEPGEGTTSFQT